MSIAELSTKSDQLYWILMGIAFALIPITFRVFNGRRTSEHNDDQSPSNPSNPKPRRRLFPR